MPDAEKTLKILVELWAHQNGVKVKEVKIIKK